MRITSTNSGPDSRGVVRFGQWELEGEAYLYVVVGAIGTVLVFVLSARFSYPARFTGAALPLGAAVAWVRFFLAGRPPHFTGDFFEGLLVGKHFNLQPQEWSKTAHPRGLRVRGTTASVDGERP